jgi:hypothetical protein
VSHAARKRAKPTAHIAFVPIAPAELNEILCVQQERIVARDNTVSFGRLRLQLPQSRLRPHYVNARVRVHQYPDGNLAIFHGPRAIARYTADGEPIEPQENSARIAA